MKLPMPRYIAKDRQRWRFDLPSPMPPGFEEVYLATDYVALDAERQRLEEQRNDWRTIAATCERQRDEALAKLVQVEGQLHAKQSALEFAHAAISDAIYLEDGLDVETGQRVQRIVVEAMERGTFDAPTQIADFLTRRERQQQEYMSKVEQRVAEVEGVLQQIVDGEFDDLDPNDGLHTNSVRQLAKQYLHSTKLA